MTEEQEKEKIEDVFGPHDLDVSGFSETVQARFAEATKRVEAVNDYMLFPGDLERAMIGTTTSRDGRSSVVAVYERALCIKCKMESYGPDWRKACGFEDENGNPTGCEMGESEEDELYIMAVDDFDYNTMRSLPYQYEHAPIVFEAFTDGEDRSDKTRWDEPIIARGDNRFDDALLGTWENADCEHVAVYDIGLLGDRVADLLKELGDGPRPILINHFTVDNERFEAFREEVNEETMEKLMYA